MGDAERGLVAGTVRGCCEARDWPLVALNVRTNHVHVVVEPAGRSPEEVMSAMKAVATGALRRAGRIEADRKPWGRHGSTRYLFEEEAVPSVVSYVVERQGVNLDGAWYLVGGFVYEDG